MPVGKGLYAALLTPFDDSGEAVNTDALGQLVERNLDDGLDGLYVAGSSGEAFLMSEAEREQVLAATAEAAAGRGALIAHVGDINPSVSRRLARAAQRYGYDAFSAVPPFYYEFGFSEIAAHYERLATAADIPFLVYNFPALSGVTMTSEQLAHLLALPNVVGVKNTCSDYFAFEQLRRRCPDALLYNGFDETLLAGLCLGADGGIGSTYNLMATGFVALAQAHHRGDTEAARAIQADINRVIDVIAAHGVFGSLKFLLSREGIAMGPCRPPFQPLERPAMRSLEEAYGRLSAQSNLLRRSA